MGAPPARHGDRPTKSRGVRAMASRIVFAAAEASTLVVRVVQEDPAEVQEALSAAQGRPFRLTDPDGGDVYVNPGTIAYWTQYDPGGHTTQSAIH